MTQAEYARHRGITRQAVNVALKSGRITALPDGRIDAEVADREWEERTDPVMQREPGGGCPDNPFAPAPGTLAYWRARWLQFQTEALEIELARMRGELVPVAEVRTEFFRFAREARDRILAVPARVASLLVNKVDAAEIKAILEDELRAALTALSRDLRSAPAPVNGAERGAG